MMLKNISNTTIEQMSGGLFCELHPGEVLDVGSFSAQLWLTNHGHKLERIDIEKSVEVKEETPEITFAPKKRGRPRKTEITV